MTTDLDRPRRDGQPHCAGQARLDDRAHGRLWARWGLDPMTGAMDGVWAEWRAGRWTRMEPARRPPPDIAPERCFPDGLLTPGLLNAHVHLDYSYLLGQLPGGAGIVPWLRAMIAARRAFVPADASAADAACRAALRSALAAGTTTLWDIDSLGWGRAALAESGVPSISFKEWIAPSRRRWQEAWKAFQATQASPGVAAPSHPSHPSNPSHSSHSSHPFHPSTFLAGPAPGLSPHAPCTVCPEGLRALADLAAERRLPLAIHLAESPEERELLVEGRGALRDLLAELGDDPVVELGVGRGAIARAEEAGLLGPATLAIHANLPDPGDAERLARSGAVVVFCPRSHRFFGYPPYPLGDYLKAGARLALGTDSLASNASLDMREEAREAIARFPEIGPRQALALAGGAMLGEAPPFGGHGRLAVGARADWAIWQGDAPAFGGAPTPDRLAAFWLDPATRRARSSVFAQPSTA
jgi:cytosine/adenosine deaminase-related metal-dependent hydrolase